MRRAYKVLMAVLLLLCLAGTVQAGILAEVEDIFVRSEIGGYVYAGFEQTERPRVRSAELNGTEVHIQFNTNLVGHGQKAYTLPVEAAARQVTKQAMAYVIKELFELSPAIDKVLVEVWAPVYIDKYGNVEEHHVGSLSMARSTYRKVNWEMASIDIIAGLFAETWTSVTAQRDPGETARQMLRLAWSGEIEEALQYWHPAVDRNLARVFLEAMAEAAAEQGAYVMLAIIDLVSFDVQPIGYDRFIVTPTFSGEPFDDATRLMVQRYEGKCVMLLPGQAFDAEGIVSEEGIVFWRAADRPDPNIDYRTGTLAMLNKDYETLRAYTSQVVPDVFVAESVAEVPDEEEEPLMPLIKAYAATLKQEVTYIDPFTAVLGEKDKRTAMRWEDGMWKMLPPLGLEVVYEDYEEGL